MFKVIRGGAWAYDEEDARTSNHGYWHPDGSSGILGFRIVRKRRTHVFIVSRGGSWSSRAQYSCASYRDNSRLGVDRLRYDCEYGFRIVKRVDQCTK